MNYRITIDLKNVAEGDATDLAQRIHDEYGEDFDAPCGEFVVSVATVKDGGGRFDTGWEPE